MSDGVAPRPSRRARGLALGALGAAAAVAASCVGRVVVSERVVRPADLPARIALKTPTESFTHAWYLALRDGRVWRRPNPETTGEDEPWELLPPDGLPRHSARRAGATLVELSADGENLVAVDDDGLVHYTKLGDLKWIESWGLPPNGATLHAPRERRALHISHRGPLVGGYEDIDGNSHPVSAGVTTYYLLEQDGRSLRYADPWLPEEFARRIALPLRDRFIAAGLSASASTLFVVDRRGRLFTRLADYDTLGENPVLPYTYERGLHEGQSARVLPPEDWQEQPGPPGRITARITILQTGPGNGGRELRVEGTDAAGAPGHWARAIRDTAWRFVPGPGPLSGPLLDPQAPEAEVLGPRRGRDYTGRIVKPVLNAPLRVELLDFHPVLLSAVLRLSAGDARLELPLHLRDTDRDDAGRIASLDGTLLVPQGGPRLPGLEALLGDARLVECEVKLEEDGRVLLERSLAEKNLTRPFLIELQP